jgi:hypothetical protein
MACVDALPGSLGSTNAIKDSSEDIFITLYYPGKDLIGIRSRARSCEGSNLQ